MTPQGAIKTEGIFISRLVKGGLAESTGLLGPDDEVIEVNGIDVITTYTLIFKFVKLFYR